MARSRASSSDTVIRSRGTEPTWPEHGPDDHPVTELVSDRQGSLSPFGDVVFPLPADELGYEHPHTVINR